VRIPVKNDYISNSPKGMKNKLFKYEIKWAFEKYHRLLTAAVFKCS
jgi:hypothetical protein